MAVVRILTRSPEDAGALAELLRLRGYTVEVVTPGVAPRHALEWEITLESCATADAFQHAAEMAQEGGMDVFVAPGTFAGAHIAAVPRVEVPAPLASEAVETPQAEPCRELQAVTGVASAAVANLLVRFRVLAMAAVATIGEFTHRAAGQLAAHGALRRRRREQGHRVRRPASGRKGMAAPKARVRPAPLPVIRRTRSREREWKTTAIVSLLLAIAVAVGWAAANRQPASPVSTSVLVRSNTVQQQVPFGPATLPAPVTMTVPPNAPSVAPQSASPVPHASERHEFGPEVVVRHFNTVRKSAPSPPPDDSDAEVVVRHFPRGGAVAKRR